MSLTIDEIQLYENLCLLGIIGGAKPLLGSQGLDLKANTFRKPSSRAIEFTIYHLYSILMGEDKAIKDLKSFFPVNDASMAKEFNGKVSDWLKSLKDQNLLEINSIVTASQLRSASGYRLVSTLLDLSCLAVQHLLQRLDPTSASASPFSTPSPPSSHPHPKSNPPNPPNPPPQVMREQIPQELLEAARSIAAVDVQCQLTIYKGLAREASESKEREERAAASLRDSFYSLQQEHRRVTSDSFLSHESLKVLNTTLTPNPSTLSSSIPGAPHPSLSGINQASHPHPLPPLPPLSPSSFSSPGLKGLLLSLKSHVGQYYELKRMLDSVVTSSVHPHAIDGSLLASTIAGPSSILPSSSTSSTSSINQTQNMIDLSLLMDTWSRGLQMLLPHFQTLSGIHRGTCPHPLVAQPNSASSHSALLSTQLSLHKESVKRLRMTTAEVRERISSAEVRVEELGPLVLLQRSEGDPVVEDQVTHQGGSVVEVVEGRQKEEGCRVEEEGRSQVFKTSYPPPPPTPGPSQMLFPPIEFEPPLVFHQTSNSTLSILEEKVGGDLMAVDERSTMNHMEVAVIPPPNLPTSLPPPPLPPQVPAVLHIAQKQLPKGIVGNFNSVLSQLGGNALFQKIRASNPKEEEGPSAAPPNPPNPPNPPALSLNTSLDQWAFKTQPQPRLSLEAQDDVAAASRDNRKAEDNSLDSMLVGIEMDIDLTPSAEDIGAVLRALDCTPLTFNPGARPASDAATRRLTFGSTVFSGGL